MSAPRISVVMPVFNAARYLHAAIVSVLAQTFSDLEFIIVDDGSTDGSLQIAQNFRDERIRIFSNVENCGAAKSKNLGIKNARGEFIAFLDADDIALPSRFLEQSDFLLRNKNVGVVGSLAARIDENGATASANLMAPHAPDEIAPTLLFENCLVQSSVMLRRNILPAELFRTEFEPAEDYELWTRLAPTASIAIIEHPLVQYRTHPGGVSARKTAQMEASVRAIHTAQLAQLDIAATPQQLELHAKISQWPPASTKQLVEHAEEWLLTLHRANIAHPIYEQPAFEKTIARRWHAVCRDSWQLGCWSWKAYWRSPLRRLAPVTLAQKYEILRHALPQTFRRSSA